MRQTLGQIAWLIAGIVLVTGVSRLAHSGEHGHDHGHNHAAHAHEEGHDHDHAHEGEAKPGANKN
jgi:zinc and cadmium transporter